MDEKRRQSQPRAAQKRVIRLPDGPFRDVVLWFENLVRDLPQRTGRLCGTLMSAPVKSSPAGYVFWIHALFWYLFDFVGGPEIVQFWLRLGTETRPLTDGEITAVAQVLGLRAIRYRDVRIAQRGVLRYAFGLNKNRAFATWHTINLPDGRDSNLPLLVHELTHTYQYERVGSIYIGQGLWVQAKMGRSAYGYGGPPGLEAGWAAGKRYKDYNREQQGQIAQDYCTLVSAGGDTSAYEPFIVQLRQGQL